MDRQLHEESELLHELFFGRQKKLLTSASKKLETINAKLAELAKRKEQLLSQVKQVAASAGRFGRKKVMASLGSLRQELNSVRASSAKLVAKKEKIISLMAQVNKSVKHKKAALIGAPIVAGAAYGVKKYRERN